MDFYSNNMLLIDYEMIRHQHGSHQVHDPFPVIKPALSDRALTALGDLLCRVGTNLKKYSNKRLSAEEASSPSYIITL